MSDLVDDRLADLLDDLSLGGAGLFDVGLKQDDAVGHHHSVGVAALGQWRALIQAEEQLIRFETDGREFLGRGLVV